MRASILIALLGKDAKRLSRNAPACLLLAFLVLIAVLVSATGPTLAPEPPPEAQAVPGAKCWIVYDAESPWVTRLRRTAPESLDVAFVDASRFGGFADDASIPYPPGVSGIELRGRTASGQEHVRYRHPGSDPSVLWPWARWFLSQSSAYFSGMPAFFEDVVPIAGPPRPAVEDLAVGDLLTVPLLATMLLLSTQFFAALALLVSFASQEREHGTLRAVALTRARPVELLVARYLFHAALSVGLCVIVVALLDGQILARPLFFATVTLTTLGFLAIGTLLASLARSHSAASLLSFAYLMGIGIVFFLSTKFAGFAVVREALFEPYALTFTLVSVADTPPASPFGVLGHPLFLRMAILVGLWHVVAAAIFIRRGWR